MSGSPDSTVPRWRGVSFPAARAWEWAGFAAAVGLSLALNTWRLSHNGDGNTYYAAAVRSMTVSWSNFFFGAFDPGGFITVDKPPVFLWVGALSVKVFGYSSWSILLPSAVVGTATVALLWVIVRRYFGPLAATISGVALAVTPITVAVDRLNLPEPILILTLLGAAGAILWSLESRRWLAWTLLAGALVGVAFNTKMLAAWIPGPALALAVVAAYPRVYRLESLRRVALQLVVLAGATFVVSASWMLVVDHWPGDRPYIGGSKDDTVQELMMGHNGLARVEANNGPGGRGPRPPQANPSAGNPPVANRGNVSGAPPAGPPPNGPQPNRGVPGPGGANGPGGIIGGDAGPWRMFDAANGAQIAWLLPLALLGAIPALWEWRRARGARTAVVLFLGWVLSFGLVFSLAKGLYHSYYTAALAPGIAAMAGITVATSLRMAARDRRWLLGFVPVVVVTVWVQLDIAGRFPGHQEDAPMVALAVVIAGSVAVGAMAIWRLRTAMPAAVAVVMAGLLVIPGAWSYYEVTTSSTNTTLPQAGPRQGPAGRTFGSQAFDGGVASLAEWLNAHRDTAATWDLAMTSAQNASTLIARYDLSVMAIGGFSGSDPTISVEEFAAMVEARQVRYVLTTQGGPGAGRPLVPPGIEVVALPGPVPAVGGGPGGRPGGPSLPPGESPAGPQPGPPPGTRPGGPPVSGGAFVPAPPPAGSATRGANVIMAAVRSACVPVTGPDVPLSHQGSLYDCAGRVERLKALASSR